MNEWVLVVDDDVTNLKMASRILSSKDIRVSCAKSGEDAIKFLHDNKPDIILMDVHMPDMDGFGTIEALKSDDAISDIPFIFLTADDDRDTEIRGIEAGAMDFIRKPFIPQVLILRVQNAIELARYRTGVN